MGTNAKPTAKANAPIGSVELEFFLNNLEEELISRVEDFYHNEKLLEVFDDFNEAGNEETQLQNRNKNNHNNNNNSKGRKLNREINNLLEKIKKEDMVIIPTDKTNSFQPMKLNKYIKEVGKHLNEGAIPSNRDKIVEIYKQANHLLIKISKLLNNKEIEHLKEVIETKAIPTPKLLIKDHKSRKVTGTSQQD